MENIKELITSIDVNNLLTIFDIQIAIAIVVVFTLFRSLFSKIVISVYNSIIKRDKPAKESSMYKPLNIFFVLLGVYFAINILPTSAQVLYTMNNIFKIVVIIILTKGITTLISEDSPILKKITKGPENKAVNTFVYKIINFLIWVVSIFIIINELGYDLSGLVTGLGLSSAVIALAAQDMVKSLLSGMTILTDKPFIIGDLIEVGSYQGTVIDITYRSTRIKTASQGIVTIPNSTITSEYVINWNKLTSRKFECILNLSLETTSDKIKKIIKQIKLILENNQVIIKDTIQVNFNAISNSSNDINIILFVKETDYKKYIKIKEELLCSLLELIEKENIDLAYPTQTIYLKNNNEKGAEG